MVRRVHGHGRVVECDCLTPPGAEGHSKNCEICFPPQTTHYVGDDCAGGHVEDAAQTLFGTTDVQYRRLPWLKDKGAIYAIYGASSAHYADELETRIADLDAEVAMLRDALGQDRHHIAEFVEHNWTLEHPMECRIDGLINCPLNKAIADGGPPPVLGRYRVTVSADGVLNASKI